MDHDIRFKVMVRRPLVTRHLVQYHVNQGSDEIAPQYSVHRQLQWKILNDLDSNTKARQQTFDYTVAIIHTSFPRLSDFMIPMFDEWNSYQRSIAHVLRLAQVFHRSSQSTVPLEGSIEFAELLISAGNYLYEVRIMKSSISIVKAATQVCEKLLAR